MRGACVLLALTVAIGALAPSALDAQRLPEPRIGAFAAPVVDTLPRVGRQPLPPGFVTQQAFAGFAGLTVGGLLGGLAGSALVQDGGEGWDELAGVVFGMVIGGSVGSSVAIYRFSTGKGYRSSYPVTLLGSVAGWFGGPLFWVTVPIGGAVGYNAARK